MSAIDFRETTQSKSWTFDVDSLRQCRQKIVSERMAVRNHDGSAKVRKFASGFHHRFSVDENNMAKPLPNTESRRSAFFEPLCSHMTITENEQDTLVRFHAHQMASLAGQNAILPGLVGSNTVLSTAIVLFRRFYLSNSILDFRARKIAVAAVMLASKLEDEKVEIDLLEQASGIIYQKVKSSEFCRQELCYVTVDEIATSELQLMEGINYEMIVHHPFRAIRVLTAELQRHLGINLRCNRAAFTSSPCSIYEIKEEKTSLYEKAKSIALKSMMFSDCPFLFAPGKIAFAAVALAINDSMERSDRLPPSLRQYLCNRFKMSPNVNLVEFEKNVSSIMVVLGNCKTFRASPTSSDISNVGHSTGAEELRHVIVKVTSIRAQATNAKERQRNWTSPQPAKRRRSSASRSFGFRSLTASMGAF